MGIQGSKEQLPDEKQTPETSPGLDESLSSSPSSSPILTPLDPRSPSENIARTPLETVLGYVEEESPIVLSDDPRSPTLAFERTPIVVTGIPKRKKIGLMHNKSVKTILSCEVVTPKTIAPKLLDSTPKTIQANNNKRKSFVGLLETNIDYTETDLDAFAAQKRLSVAVVTEEKIEETEKIDEEETEDIDEEEEDTQLVPVQNKLEELKLETILDAPQEKQPTKEDKLINITAHVTDLDKKLTNLIYQDDSGDEMKVHTPKLNKFKENNRTPLGTKNGPNESTKKSAGKLRVNDKPRKTDFSKIPVPKDKKGKKFDVQCENTPPRAITKNGGRVTKWDAERTLVI